MPTVSQLLKADKLMAKVTVIDLTLKECLFINNNCYKTNEKMSNSKPTGIVVHSTACNNKTLKRYVQPVPEQSYYDEVIADLGKNKYDNHWNNPPEKIGRNTCVHAFIGVNAKGKVETYQTLPFDICCWGVGRGERGSYNYNPTARIQFEICEDNLSDVKYFTSAMKEAQEFCAYLCKKFHLTVDKISSHYEAYLGGYGNAHGDCDHWLSCFEKNMNWFRAEVQKLLDSETQKPTTEFKAGDIVTFDKAVYYGTDVEIPTLIQEKNWIISSINGNRVVLNKSEDGKFAICSAVHAKYLIHADKKEK